MTPITACDPIAEELLTASGHLACDKSAVLLFLLTRRPKMPRATKKREVDSSAETVLQLIGVAVVPLSLSLVFVFLRPTAVCVRRRVFLVIYDRGAVNLDCGACSPRYVGCANGVLFPAELALFLAIVSI